MRPLSPPEESSPSEIPIVTSRDEEEEEEMDNETWEEVDDDLDVSFEAPSNTCDTRETQADQ